MRIRGELLKLGPGLGNHDRHLIRRLLFVNQKSVV
jgi:hypothetical protein